MTKKVFTKIKIAISEKTKRMFLCGRVNKKSIIIGAIVTILIIVLGIGVLAANWKIDRYNNANLNMARNGDITKHYPSSIQPNNGDEFVLPQDAAKSGEIAIVVNDLDSAKNNVQNIAVKNGGIVYDTFIAYASNKIKSGSIVIQIPKANFDATLSDLEKIGSQVVQESVRQIPAANQIIYPQPQPMAEVSDNSGNVPKENSTVNSNVTNGAAAVAADQNTNNPTIAPAPTIMPIYPQIAQDKGYIKVIFADYGKSNDSAIATVSKTNIGNILGVGYGGQNMRENIWVVLAIKSIVLIVLIWVIVIIARRIIVNLQKIKRSKKSIAPTVKQVT